MLAVSVYWHLLLLQMPEQQSAFVRQEVPDCPQQLQLPPGIGPVNRHCEVVPSDLRHCWLQLAGG